MKTDSEILDQNIQQALAGELSATERAALKQLLAVDPAAMDRYLEFCEMEAWLSAPAAENENVVIEMPTAEMSPTHSSSILKWAGLAAAIAMGLGVAFWIGKKEAPSNSPQIAETEPQSPIKKQPTASKPNTEKVIPIYAQSLKHPAGKGKLQGGVPDGELVEKIPETISFNRHVRGILSENCFHCHGPDANKRKAELRLDEREAAVDSLSPGNSATSELVARLFSDDADELMPPPESNRHLTQGQREILKRWIEQGAKYEGHWAYEPPARTSNIELPTPNIRRENAIDFFVKLRLDEEALGFSEEADRRTLIRRLSLDLIGLPPTVAELDAFLTDESADAYEKVVDRLMASPHYGERMVLPWLDAARYADSNGFQGDGDRHQYIWRDWVVNAMNSNMPFDQFTVEQIAGDLFPNPTQDQLIATGFNRNHVINGEGGAIAEEQRNNTVFDRVDTTATTFLGLTLACAQCHDHKYDALSQVDYYRFFAYFNQLPESGKVDRRLGRVMVGNPAIDIATDEQLVHRKALDKTISASKKAIRDNQTAIDVEVTKWWKSLPKDKVPEKLKPVIGREFATFDGYNQGYAREGYLRSSSNPEWKKWQRDLDQSTKGRDALMKQMKVVMVMGELEGDKKRKTHLFLRGDYESHGEEVQPGVPEALHNLPSDAPANRMALAKWLVSEENPLTSRVIANRYWQHYFGIGLVKTSEDFGVQGEQPSHPELLDWLAVEFRESGWNVKHMHKLIVMSRTYRQSSNVPSEMLDRDPENRLLSRATRFRLPSMLLRDQALQLSGLLKDEVGGAPVYPYQPEGLWHEFSYEKFKYTPDHGDKLYRRSLYTFWRRTIGPPNIFDAANRQVCMVKPSRTNTPLHALTTLNDPTYVEAARVWAEKMAKTGDAEKGIRDAFLKATGREILDNEMAILKRTLTKARDNFGSNEAAAKELLTVGEMKADGAIDAAELASFAQVAQLILNLDEVLNRE